jgi:hypothetical protein
MRPEKQDECTKQIGVMDINVRLLLIWTRSARRLERGGIAYRYGNCTSMQSIFPLRGTYLHLRLRLHVFRMLTLPH